MKVIREDTMLHPLLVEVNKRINTEIIQKHNSPFAIFETGREHDRQESLLKKGKTKDFLSRHLFNLENDPPLYATAVDYVYYNNKWSWNLRDSTIASWYILFGNMVLDLCPELEWGGTSRKSVNYCHFQLRRSAIINYLDSTPCVVPN